MVKDLCLWMFLFNFGFIGMIGGAVYNAGLLSIAILFISVILMVVSINMVSKKAALIESILNKINM